MDKISKLQKRTNGNSTATLAVLLLENGGMTLEALAEALQRSPRQTGRILQQLQVLGLVAYDGVRWHAVAAEADENGAFATSDTGVIKDKEKEDLEDLKTLDLIGHGCPNTSSTAKTPTPQPDTSAHDHPEAPEAGPAGQAVRALKQAGAWGEVYRLLRPYFPTPRLWVRYLETLAAILAELGPDGFAYGVRFALAQLARGMARHAPAYFRAVLKDQLGLWRGQVVFSPPGPKPKPPLPLEDGQEVAFLTAAGELKRGFFAGWTGGYRLAFVDTGGLVYRVPVERLRVEGLTA